MANRDVIGVTACPHCGTLDEMRVNSGLMVYLKCHGEVDGQRCGFSCIWPGAESKQTRAAAARDGWLGPIPYGYFPPTKSDGNSYAHILDGIDYETRRNVAPYIINLIGRGAAAVPPATPAPAPAPAATERAEPVAERVEPVERAKPRRRLI